MSNLASSTINDTFRMIQAAGLWASPKVYSLIYGVPEQTLATWRYHDKLAGREGAETGKPPYRRWGKSVKYWLAPGTYEPTQVSLILSQLPKRKAPNPFGTSKRKTVQAAVTV